jgi:glycosyltransferase involved in cell wall biosynthesis
MNNRYLINASNLHFGGGVQVATSFISELVNLKLESNFSLLLSKKVKDNLDSINCNLDSFEEVNVVDIYGLMGIHPKFKKYFNCYSKVFTVFGPNYSYMYAKYNVVGFAQPWIIYPDNPIFRNMGFFNKLKTRFKYYLQTLFFLKSDEIIVELEHVRLRIEFLFKNSPMVHVVYNSYSSVYDDPRLWSDIPLPAQSSDVIKIGYLTRDYPHKNIDILPDVLDTLKNDYNLDVEFYVTLSNAEWHKKNSNFKNKTINIGELNVSQCPTFIKLMDAMIFPSYLECFSAMPLETLKLGKPLFASNLPFVTDVCGDNAFYFEPSSPKDIAKKIYEYFVLKSIALNVDPAFGSKFSATNRALSYSKIINKN